jgi:hypothetical protein
MPHLIGTTRNNMSVYVDLIGSNAAQHIAQRPHLLNLTAEALRGMSPRGTDITVEHDMGRPVGYDFVVTTSTDTEAVFYAQQVKDSTYTRFIKNQKPSATQYLTLVLQRNEQQSGYNLQDVWIGRFTPPQPGSTTETDDSRTYWADHARIFDSQPLQVRSLTKECPY